MNENELDVSTPMDDASGSGPSEQELLDAVMANSPIMEEAAPPLPEEEIEVPDPTESEEEVEDPDSEEVEAEGEVEEEEAEEEEEVAEDDTSTQEAAAYELDELEDFQVNVKIDGEETAVSIQDLVKGYTTDQSLSKKGRELSEAREALDAERAEKLAQVENMAEASAAMLGQTEQAFAKEYHEVEKQIETARANGDTYEMNELKDKRELAQQKYWNARRQREGLLAAVQQQKQEVQAQQWEAEMQHFAEAIPEMIPDFNEQVAMDIRNFAIEEGINPDVLDQITDPMIVKFVDDYRRLKQGVSKGTAKRKAAPAKKAVPTKKAKAPAKKKADAEKMVKARAFKEDASQEDQMAFLRQHASRTLNL